MSSGIVVVLVASCSLGRRGYLGKRLPRSTPPRFLPSSVATPLRGSGSGSLGPSCLATLGHTITGLRSLVPPILGRPFVAPSAQ